MIPMRDHVRLAADVFLPKQSGTLAGDFDPHALQPQRRGCRRLSLIRQIWICRRDPGCAGTIRVTRYISRDGAGGCGWQRHHQLDLRATLVDRTCGYGGRFVFGNRAVVGSRAGQPAPGGDCACFLRRRRIHRPILFAGRRNEAGASAPLAFGEPDTALPNAVAVWAAFIDHVPLRTADLAATGISLPIWQQSLNHPSFDAYWKALSIRRADRSRKRARIIDRRLVRRLCRKRSGRFFSADEAQGDDGNLDCTDWPQPVYPF